MSAKRSRLDSLHKINEGVKSGSITDADFLSLALSKRKKTGQENITPIKKTLQNKENTSNSTHKAPLKISTPGKFQTDACEPAVSHSDRIPLSSPPMERILAPFHKKMPSSPAHDTNSQERYAIQQNITQQMREIEQEEEERNREEEQDIPPLLGASYPPLVEKEERGQRQGEREGEKNVGIDHAKQQLVWHLLSLLNNASYEELLRLRGIGPARATAILTHRNSNNVFEQLDDLQEVGLTAKGVGKFWRENLTKILD